MTVGVIERACRKCGCSDDNPCLLDNEGTVIGARKLAELTDEQLDEIVGGSCSWVEHDLCSSCLVVGAPALLTDQHGRPLRGAP